MVKTIKPYGSIGINEVDYVYKNIKGCFVRDRYGFWQIEEETFIKLKKRGIRCYERRWN